MSQNIQVAYLDDYLVQGVEFVGLVTRNGRLTDYRSNNGLKLTEEQKEMFFMSISLYESMQQDFDDNLGAVKYTITERGNHKIVAIPKEHDIVVLIMKSSFASTIKKVKEAINHVKNLDVNNRK